jgi:hypothetical protein
MGPNLPGTGGVREWTKRLLGTVSTKSEARNPKQIQSPEKEMSETATGRFRASRTVVTAVTPGAVECGFPDLPSLRLLGRSCAGADLKQG